MSGINAKTFYGMMALFIMLSSVVVAEVHGSADIGFPSVNIGVNLQSFPELTPVPGYPALLRARGQCQLFLLRWHVLGLPER